MARVSIPLSTPPSSLEIQAAQDTISLLVADHDVAELVRQARRLQQKSSELVGTYPREAAMVADLGVLAANEVIDIEL